MPNDDPPLQLSDISTSWRRVADPSRFVMTYGDAAKAYLVSILKNVDQAEEVLQDLLVTITTQGFQTFRAKRGRFRDYFKTILRNAAINALKKKKLTPISDQQLEGVSAPPDESEETTWRIEWQRCLLSAAWRGLDRHQRNAGKENFAYLVLRVTTDHPHLSSTELAVMVSQQANQPLTPEAFRKQLSRARRVFAELIVLEVRRTMESANDEEILEELADIQLLQFVIDFLPKPE